MDWNRVEGNWKEMKGKVKEKWGKLTDDDLTAINGKRDQLEGALQRRYGYAEDQAKQDEARHRYLVFDAALSAVEAVRVPIRREIAIALRCLSRSRRPG